MTKKTQARAAFTNKNKKKQWLVVIGWCFTWLIPNTRVLAENNSLSSDSESNSHPAPVCLADIPQAFQEILSLPQYRRSRWGIEIQNLHDGSTVYSLNGEQFFTPASSLKLLTSAAVLAELGANYRLVTPILAEGSSPHLSSLRLQGQGDPTISTTILKQIVHQLQELGVTTIEQLIIDDSYFSSPAIAPSWEWLDVHSYFATAVNSAILNQNTVTLTLIPQQLGQSVKYTWSDRIAGRQWQVINQGTTGVADLPYNITIDGDLGKPLLKIRGELAMNEPPDVWHLAVVAPADYFLESWRMYLAQGGIKVKRGIVIQEPQTQQPEREQILLSISSPNIATIIRQINQQSNNLYAEAIAKVLAKKLKLQDSTTAITYSLIKLGVNPEEYILVDASGLSRQNLVTPQALVKTLTLIKKSDSYLSEVYLQSLAVAGINGTLKHRFRQTAIQGRFWGKTGTLTGVGTLSGYLFTPHHGTLVLSIIVNNSDLSSKQIRQVIDRLVLILNHSQPC